MKNKDWFKPRGYLHIDPKIFSSEKEKIKRMVRNPNFVANHAFYPLLYKEIKQRRYKIVGYNKQGNPIRSHKKKNNKGKVESTAKIRPIHYASHIDSQIYAYYSALLSSKYENILKDNPLLSECITAYRKHLTLDGIKYKSSAHFANDVFAEIKRRGECAAIAFDIKGFFSSLNHKILKEQWQTIIGKDRLDAAHFNVYKSVTHFRYINLKDLKVDGRQFDEQAIAKNMKNGYWSFFSSNEEFRQKLKTREIRVQKNFFRHKKTDELMGIPQGLPISSTLANIYMLEFDKELFRVLCSEKGCFYRRYSDDIVIVCSIDIIEEVTATVKSLIEGTLANLFLSEEKTEISLFRIKTQDNGESRLQVYRSINGVFKENVPFVYLGLEFYGYQTLLKSASIARFYRRMKEAVRKCSRRADKLMEKQLIDKKILYKTKLYRMFSFHGIKSKELNSKRTFFYVDHDGRYKKRESSEPVRFRGNYLRYAERVSNDINAPEIKRQLKRHWTILQNAISKYSFYNTKH